MRLGDYFPPGFNSRVTVVKEGGVSVTPSGGSAAVLASGSALSDAERHRMTFRAAARSLGLVPVEDVPAGSWLGWLRPSAVSDRRLYRAAAWAGIGGFVVTVVALVVALLAV
jgi:hypothetical protein